MATTRQDQKRRPRKLDRDEDLPVHLGRNESSEGGVLLSNAKKGDQNMSSTAGSHSRRRRPRKLGRADTEPVMKSSGLEGGAGYKDIGVEISTLKTRVCEIEGQVQELLNRPGATPPKLSRRRARQQKPKREGETPREELERLRDNLAAAREELAQLRMESGDGLQSQSRAIASTKRYRGDVDSDIEEISRSMPPGFEQQVQNKPVVLSGSYRIPLPAAVDERDVVAVQRGISSVGNIARSILDAREEANQGVMDPQDRDMQPTRSGSGWSSWIGSYSVSLAKMVNNIQINSPSEDENYRAGPSRRLTRSQTAPVPRRNPPKLRIGNGQA